MPRDPLLTVKEVAEWLAVSETWVRDHATGRRRPALPAIALGGSKKRSTLRFSESAVSAWIEALSKKVA